LSTIYGNFLYNFTTPDAPLQEFNFLGTASQEHVRTGYSFYNNSGNLWTGTMPSQSLSSSSTTVSAGYYSATTLTAIDADLTTANIKSGTNIFGIAGSSNVVDTTTGTLTNAAQVRSGYIAWSDGTSWTGTMPTQTLSASSVTVNEGYYAATTLSSVDSDMIANNIRKGVNLFGITGTWGPGLGDEYGGGKIIYINPSTGYVLIGAIEDANSGGICFYGPNLNAITPIGSAQGMGIGSGKSNTAAIIAYHGTQDSAAKFCTDYRGGGYDDWFLPSIYELQLFDTYGLHSNLFGHTHYWSSSEISSNTEKAHVYDFLNHMISYQWNKYNVYDFYVRCAREITI